MPNSRVPWLHRHYPASLLLRTHPSPSRLQLISRWTGYTTYLASADFAAGRGGLLQLLSVSLSPCCRSHPAGVDRRVSQTATSHTAFTCTVAGSASGAPHVRGHLCVRVRYGLGTRPHPADEAVERLQKVGGPSPCSPSYRALAFPLVGFPPTEHASLRWTHNRTCGFHRIRLSTLVLFLVSSRPSSIFHIFVHAFMPGREEGKHSSTHVWHNQLAHSRDTPSCSRTPKARGLRQGEYSPCGRRYRPPTTTPHPPLLSGIGISSGVSPFLLSTSLHILRDASRVQHGRLKRNDVGGVLLAAPSALCGSPVNIQGRSG